MGRARVEKDAVNYKAVINGKGRDTRGAGNAQALITAQMVPIGATTQVDIVTDLKVSGKVAQFGRGVMQDVSAKLLGQFAECLEKKIADTADTSAAPVAAAGATAATAGAAAAAEPAHATPAHAATTPATGTTPTPAASPSYSPGASAATNNDDDDVLDLSDIGVGSALAKRAAPAVGGVAVLTALFWLLRRLRSGSSE